MGQKKICSICGNVYEGFGHNAQPINNGRCCRSCNNDVVIPIRHQSGLVWIDKKNDTSEVIEMKSHNGLCFDYHKGKGVLTDYHKIYVKNITEENLSEAVNTLGTLYDKYVFMICSYEKLLEDYEDFMKNPTK